MMLMRNSSGLICSSLRSVSFPRGVWANLWYSGWGTWFSVKTQPLFLQEYQVGNECEYWMWVFYFYSFAVVKQLLITVEPVQFENISGFYQNVQTWFQNAILTIVEHQKKTNQLHWLIVRETTFQEEENKEWCHLYNSHSVKKQNKNKTKKNTPLTWLSAVMLPHA